MQRIRAFDIIAGGMVSFFGLLIVGLALILGLPETWPVFLVGLAVAAGVGGTAFVMWAWKKGQRGFSVGFAAGISLWLLALLLNLTARY